MSWMSSVVLGFGSSIDLVRIRIHYTGLKYATCVDNFSASVYFEQVIDSPPGSFNLILIIGILMYALSCSLRVPQSRTASAPYLLQIPNFRCSPDILSPGPHKLSLAVCMMATSLFASVSKSMVFFHLEHQWLIFLWKKTIDWDTLLLLIFLKILAAHEPE